MLAQNRISPFLGWSRAQMISAACCCCCRTHIGSMDACLGHFGHSGKQMLNLRSPPPVSHLRTRWSDWSRCFCIASHSLVPVFSPCSQPSSRMKKLQSLLFFCCHVQCFH